MFEGAKKPCGKSLTSGGWSSHTNVNLMVRHWSRDFLIVVVYGEC